MDVLLKTFLKTGLVLDEIEELYFEKEHANPERAVSTANFTELPVILAFRMRKL